MKVFLENVIRDSVTYTEHARRKTVTAMGEFLVLCWYWIADLLDILILTIECVVCLI